MLSACPVPSRVRGHWKDGVLLATVGCGDLWSVAWGAPWSCEVFQPAQTAGLDLRSSVCDAGWHATRVEVGEAALAHL